MKWALAAALLLAGMHASAQQPVELTSLDAPAGTALVLPGLWFAAPAAGRAPAVLALHGCSGLYDNQGRLGPRYRELAARLNAVGVHMLATDSLTPRGEKELCTQRTGQRKVTQKERRRDALGALRWLAAQPGVDASQLGLLGWSHGGGTVLAASNLRHPEVAAATVKPTLVVAFYPGCESDLARGYEGVAPVLLLLGEADDWTPAAPCKALATSSGGRIQWESYAGAHHGFDGTAAVRLRRDVPNGVHPGQGVHVGGDPDARAASAMRLDRFIRETWSLPR